MSNAMIWGASGGIGQALTNLLMNKGWTVAAIARHPVNLDQPNVCTITTDVSSTFDIQAAVTATSQIIDEVDLWVYTVGDIASAKVETMSPELCHRLLDANLTGAISATHFSLPLLAPDAHLIFIGAISERLRLPGLGAYAAAKVGLEAFVEVLSKEQRKRRVLNIRPSAVDTPMWEKVPMRLPKGAASPQVIAEQILDAFDQKQTGTLDLT